MARQLESLGVDIIESGFPIASRGDLEGVRAVTREIRNCTVAALARARRDDIDVALDGLKGAAHPRLHMVSRLLICTCGTNCASRMNRRSKQFRRTFVTPGALRGS